MASGETIVVLSDGLPDMMDAGGAFYTMPRLFADLQSMSTFVPRDITAGLTANVQAFAAGTPAADDITVLAVRRL